MFKIGFIGDKTRLFTNYCELLKGLSSSKHVDLPESTISELTYIVLKVGESGEKELKIRSYPIPLGKQRHFAKLQTSEVHIAESIESELVLEEMGTELVLEEEEEICEIMVYYKSKLEKNEIRLLEVLEEVYTEELKRPIPTGKDQESSKNSPELDLDLEDQEEEGEDEDEFVEMQKKFRLPFLVVCYSKKVDEIVDKEEVLNLLENVVHKTANVEEEEEEDEGEEEEEEEEKPCLDHQKRKMFFYNLETNDQGEIKEDQERDFRKLFAKILPKRVFREPINSLLKKEHDFCMTVEVFKEDVILVIRKYLAQLYNLDKFHDIISRIGEMYHYYHGKLMNDNPRIEVEIQQLLKNLNSTKNRFFDMFKEEVTSNLNATDEELIKIKWQELVQSLNTLIYQISRFESEYFITKTVDLPMLNWDPNDPLKNIEPALSDQNDTERTNKIFKLKRKRRDKILRFLLRIIHYVEIYGTDSKDLFGKSVNIKNIRQTFFTDPALEENQPVVEIKKKKSLAFSVDISNDPLEDGNPKKMHLNLKSVVMPAVCSIFHSFVRKYFSDLSSNPFLLEVNKKKIIRIMKKTDTLLRNLDENVEKRKLNTKIFWFQKLIFEAFSTFIGFQEEDMFFQQRKHGRPRQASQSLSLSGLEQTLFSPSLGSSSCFQNFLFFKTFFEFLWHLSQHSDKNLLNQPLLSLLFCPSFFGMKNAVEERRFMQQENYVLFNKFFEINIRYSKAIWNYELFVEGKKLYSSTSSEEISVVRSGEPGDSSVGSIDIKKLQTESRIREKFKYHGKIKKHCQNEFGEKKKELKRLKKESSQVLESIVITLKNHDDRVEKAEENEEKGSKNLFPERINGTVGGFFFGESDLSKIPREWKKTQEKNMKTLERGERVLQDLEEFYEFLERPYKDGIDENDDDNDEEEEVEDENEKNLAIKKKQKKKKKEYPKRFSRSGEMMSVGAFVDDQKKEEEEKGKKVRSTFSDLCLFLDWMKDEHRIFDEEYGKFSAAKTLIDRNFKKMFFEDEFLESEECREYLSLANYIRLQELDISKLKKKTRRVSSIGSEEDISAMPEEKDMKGNQDTVSTLRRRSVKLLHEVIRYKEKLEVLDVKIRKLFFREFTDEVNECLKRLRTEGLKPKKKEEEEEGEDDKFKDVRCTLTKKKVSNPVILAETGEVFEKREIERYLKNNNCHPVTGHVLKSKILIPEYRLLKYKKKKE